MAHWHLLHENGAEAFVQTKRGQHPRDAGYGSGWTATRLRRAPDEHSRMVGGRLTIDRELAAASVDAAHRHRHGAHAIAIPHATKRIEAGLVLAGVTIDGLLAAEARATGQSLAELARVVTAKAAETDAYELERIAAKRAARSRSK